jgi:hypothetical protein
MALVKNVHSTVHAWEILLEMGAEGYQWRFSCAGMAKVRLVWLFS